MTAPLAVAAGFRPAAVREVTPAYDMGDSSVRACTRCGQRNTVRLAAKGVPYCGRCGAALPWLGDVSASGFRASVEESPLPVLVDFWAPWCGPCRMVGPAVERLGADLAGRLKVARVDTDEVPELGARFGVRGIPTLILFDHGRERDRITGAVSAAVLRSWVEARLSR